VEQFRCGFPGKVGYAVKANGEALVLEHLCRAGIDFFDAASISEITLVRRVHAAAAIFYDNPVKSADEIQRAYGQHGVRSFALDDEIELAKIASVIGNDPSVQLTVRFRIRGSYAAQDLSRKFGADPEEAAILLQKVKAAGYRPALTFHPGSQCYSPRAYTDYIHAAAIIARSAGVAIVMLNAGGGFPAGYRNSRLPPLDDFFSAIETQFRRWFAGSGCTLVCEPGRGLVASAASLLTRVRHRRKNINTLFLNDGIYGGFMEQVVSYFELPTRVYRGTRPVLDSPAEFTVYGPTCDSSDCFTEKILLPRSIAAGDWIEFGLTGAYGSATTTRFNGYSSEQYAIVDKVTRFAE